jgi:hypothetical protein
MTVRLLLDGDHLSSLSKGRQNLAESRASHPVPIAGEK